MCMTTGSNRKDRYEGDIGEEQAGDRVRRSYRGAEAKDALAPEGE